MLRLIKEKKGVTGIEYGMLIALIGALIIVPVASAGTNLQRIFCNVEGTLGGAACADAAAAAPSMQQINFPVTNVLGYGIRGLNAAGTAYENLGAIEVSTPAGPQSFVFYNSGLPGSTWAATASTAGAASALDSACAGGTNPAAGLIDPATGMAFTDPAPLVGIAQNSTIGTTSAAELQTLGDDPAEYMPGPTPPTFSPTQNVVTCYAPK